MKIADNIRHIRKQHGFLQKEVAAELGIGYSNYNKLEKGYRDISLDELVRISKFYGLSIDEIVFLDETKPLEVNIEDKTRKEQMDLLGELEEEDRAIIFKVVNIMLTKKRMKEVLSSVPPKQS